MCLRFSRSPEGPGPGGYDTTTPAAPRKGAYMSINPLGPICSVSPFADFSHPVNVNVAATRESSHSRSPRRDALHRMHNLSNVLMKPFEKDSHLEKIHELTRWRPSTSKTQSKVVWIARGGVIEQNASNRA